MLTLPGDNPVWKAQAIAALPSWVTLHVLDGKLGPIGPQRLAALRLGTHPYVSCIDPDDWTEPDTFDKCLAALQEHGYAGVCTQELVHDLPTGTTYICPFKHKTFVLTRQFVEDREALFRYDVLAKSIVHHPDVVQLPFVGHHWRRYRSTARIQREANGQIFL